MPAGLDNLQHIVVLMMESRSFDICWAPQEGRAACRRPHGPRIK
jgi:hypothetical protein